MVTTVSEGREFTSAQSAKTDASVCRTAAEQRDSASSLSDGRASFASAAAAATKAHTATRLYKGAREEAEKGEKVKENRQRERESVE